MDVVARSLPRIAYFCMEFALHEDLPIYAGGLGVLAGDYLKSAFDLGLPVTGVGILWQQGYTRQLIGTDGYPYDTYPDWVNSNVTDTGARVRVSIRNKEVICRVSKIDAYGNAPLILLDTNLPENGEQRHLTNRLYGGAGDDRIAQEMVLGIGGMRALRALGLDVDIYHFNEGHAVLAGLELIREELRKGLAFMQAWRSVRSSIVFTTHTPVPAGNETHHHAALQYVGAYNGLTYEQVSSIGGDPFNMTVAGLRLAKVANAVSQLHTETAREMWKDVSDSAPIIAITNGVHRGTWQDQAIASSLASGANLIAPHKAAKKELLETITGITGAKMNPDALLIGFARRAASYKRGLLIFQRPELIEPLLASSKLQLVFAGKAHPADGHGKEIIAKMVAMARRYPDAIAFVPDYELALGRALTKGCDVWLNTPLRPMEASGTSGMKAAMNGVLNLSILDGWWPEGCQHGVTGWRIEGARHGCDLDREDADSLYQVLKDEVLPTFENNPTGWERMMRSSIEMSSRFSSQRMILEYYERMYEWSNQEQASA